MGFAPQFTARTESRNGVVSIALSGELDMATVPVLDEQEAVSVLGQFTGSQTPRAGQTVAAVVEAHV